MDNIKVIKDAGKVVIVQDMNFEGKVNVIKGIIDTDGNILTFSSDGSEFCGVIGKDDSNKSNIEKPDTPPDVKIYRESNKIKLTWSEVKGAEGYTVYSSNDPFSGFEVDTTGTFNINNWSSEVTSESKFYYIVSEKMISSGTDILKINQNKVGEK